MSDNERDTSQEAPPHSSGFQDGAVRPRATRWVPLIGALVTFSVVVGMVVAAWIAGGVREPQPVSTSASHFTEDGEPLSSDEISNLRRAGWLCTDLRTIGFTWQSASGRHIGTTYELRQTFQSPAGTVVIVESREASSGSTQSRIESEDADASNPAILELRDGMGPRWKSELSTDSARFVIAADLPYIHEKLLVHQVRAQATDKIRDLDASRAGGLERLSRGFARLMEPR